MRTRLIVVVSLLALAAGVLVAGVAFAGEETALPSIGASDLLARMAQVDDVEAVSGEISWHNGLFGDLDVGGMGQLPAQSPLTSSGSGRVWVGDAGVRVESQGSGGDQIVVADKAGSAVWIYDSAAGTARRIIVAEGSADEVEPTPSPSASLLTPQAAEDMLQQVAEYATVEVSGQTTVAGRRAYLLRMTPATDDTALGVVEAAVDGETYLPLRVQVFARGDDTAVLSFGFDSVSFDAVDASMFRFTPPAGAKVTTTTVSPDAATDGDQAATDGGSLARLLRRVGLTRAEVQALVPFDLAWARDYDARPFRSGAVLDGSALTSATGTPLAQIIGAVGGTAGSAAAADLKPTTSVLVYGDGFATIVLAQMPADDSTAKQLQQLPDVFGTMTIGGVTARIVSTPLGGVIVWRHGDTTLAAAGMVPMADLKAFASTVR